MTGIHSALIMFAITNMMQTGSDSSILVADGTANLVNRISACLISVIVTAAATYMLGGFEENEEEAETAVNEPV